MALARSERALAADPARRRRLAPTAWSVVGILAPAVVLGALYLSPFLGHPTPTPFGFDTSKYMWRTELVAERGLGSLEGAAPVGLNTNPDRPAYPVVAAQVGSIARISTLRWALILPSVAAVSIGLAAGAIAMRSLREPAWAFGIYAVAVGASMQVARTAVGYADNLMVLALCLAAAAVVLRAARGDRLLPGAVLLVAAAVTHWQFAAVFAGVVLATAVLLGPDSIRLRRGGTGLASTPSARLVMIVGGAVAASYATFALGGIWPGTFANPGRHVVERKLSQFLQGFGLGPMAALAVVGIPALLWPRDRSRRDGLILVASWASVGLAGYVCFRMLGLTLPVHRLLGFSIGIPILAAAALVALVRVTVDRQPRVLAIVTVLVVVVVLVLLVTSTAARWEDNGRSFSPEQLTQVAASGRYLERVGGSEPVVFVVEGRSLSRQDHIIRAGLPAWAIPRTLLYLGSPVNLLEGRPTLTGDRKADRGSAESWGQIEPIFDERTTVLLLTTFQRVDHPSVGGVEVGPGIRVLQGPPLEGALVSIPRAETAEPIALVASALGVLLVIATVGSGWSTWVVRDGVLARAGLAPAFGFAALVLAGLFVDRLGFHLGGAPGVATAVSVGVLGWAPVLLERRRSRPPDAVAT